MTHFFTVAFYQPILNLLVWLYNTVSFGDFGIAIILLTIIIKAALWPLGQKSIKSQKALSDLQPKIDELKVKHKDNKQALGAATMAMYKENKVNPFSSCLPLIIQLPFLFAVFRIFRDGVNNNLDLVYSFIFRPEHINTFSFGFVDLAEKNLYLAVLAGAAQFWQAKMMQAKKAKTTGSKKEEGMAAIMNKQMLYFMPVITIFIGASLPGGLTLYWFIITLLTAVQQVIVFKSQKKKEEKKENKVIEGQVVE